MSLSDLPALREPPAATAAQMAEADQVAAERIGIPLEVLMENASRQTAAAARLLLGDVAGRRVVALAGSGNNGGDALGALRHLLGWGAQVHAVLSGPVERLRPLARRQHDVLVALGVPVTVAGGETDVAALLAVADLILDGLLGYSVRGAAAGMVAELIRLANASRVPILAVDLPSGLDPDGGRPLGVAIRAALTVTLALPKRGLLAPAARPLIGELLLADIGIPAKAFEGMGIDARGLFVSGDIVRIIP